MPDQALHVSSASHQHWPLPEALALVVLVWLAEVDASQVLDQQLQPRHGVLTEQGQLLVAGGGGVNISKNYCPITVFPFFK